MEIVDKIDKSLTDALKNKDQDRTLTLRSIISQKKQKEIEKRTQDKKNITDDVRNSFSVISNNFFFHEKALDYCKVVLKHNLDCKIISDI